MRKGTEKVQRKNPQVNKRTETIARAIILILPLIILSHIHFEFRPLQELLFQQVTLLLKIAGVQFETFGYTISTANFSSVLAFDCTGWRQLYLFFALVMLPPGIEAAKRAKALWLLIPLYIYNTFRAFTSIWIGTVNYELFGFVHYFLWEFVFLALIFVSWYWWYRNSVKPPRGNKLSNRALKNRQKE
ncbi:MAG: exosortase/archaeosortase family protein [Candidatus Aenigmarchaeota archaeon]|nr:exosortase/archaeosortase family protein [Candidatus Aenigmarchaeota archaeon]